MNGSAGGYTHGILSIDVCKAPGLGAATDTLTGKLALKVVDLPTCLAGFVGSIQRWRRLVVESVELCSIH